MAELERDNALQTLQNMVNLVLVETGKSLRNCNKDGTKSLRNANSRQLNNLPSFIENFHLALDDLEAEIILSKASLLRDLEVLRSKRTALEAQCVEAENQVISSNESIDTFISKEMDTVETKIEVEIEGLEKEKQLVNENQIYNTSSHLKLQKSKLDTHMIPEAQDIQSNQIPPTTKAQTTPDNLPSSQETKPREAISLKLDPPINFEPSKHSLFDLPTDQNINIFSTVSLNNLKTGMQNSGTPNKDYSQLHISDPQMFDMKNNSSDPSSTGYLCNVALGTSSGVDLNLSLHEVQKISDEQDTFIDFDDLTGVDGSALNDNAFNDFF